jgi:hypothetical protein
VVGLLTWPCQLFVPGGWGPGVGFVVVLAVVVVLGLLVTPVDCPCVTGVSTFPYYENTLN